MAVKLKKEWQQKSAEELTKRLLDLRNELKELRVKVAISDLKNVRSIRKVKREIACLLTLLNKQIK